MRILFQCLGEKIKRKPVSKRCLFNKTIWIHFQSFKLYVIGLEWIVIKQLDVSTIFILDTLSLNYNVFIYNILKLK